MNRSTETALYNTIGQTYIRSRRADPRIVNLLVSLLNLPTGSVVADIGAGTGNYTNALAERGFCMVAVEPSPVMCAQATPHPHVRWLEGTAERLPLAYSAVQGIVSTLAMHHFTDLSQSFREMDRVSGAGPMVLFTFDMAAVKTTSLWMRDYWPPLFTNTRETYPPLSEVAGLAEAVTGRTAQIVPFPLPPDIEDLFMTSGWQRPELYLDGDVRAGISPFAMAAPEEVEEGVERLRNDLDSGRWEERYGAVRHLSEFDTGYRFLVVPSSST
jgi:ubiquinone/menaquinone biosynthesis C-methylase UbiE